MKFKEGKYYADVNGLVFLCRDGKMNGSIPLNNHQVFRRVIVRQFRRKPSAKACLEYQTREQLDVYYEPELKEWVVYSQIFERLGAGPTAIEAIRDAMRKGEK